MSSPVPAVPVPTTARGLGLPRIPVGTAVVNGEEGIWTHAVRRRKPSLCLGEVVAGPPPGGRHRGRCGATSSVTCGERAVARWPRWGTILRSRELEMMDLELMRWKHVGLFYKQLTASPQTVALNPMFSLRTAGFLGLLAASGENTEKATNTLEGPL